ncbi:G-protein coupled receptor Mth2-like isoform X1 [Ostrinia furnacalis]|uniref:G-protein coupled receptor Mth2-like isoform X1 n=1 Tax=Ostrinia furnacalis TaxID=93504 RepID=UPI00103C8E46|nr:G-protein coupled receptor Mth2-like isoform X1 [Ostrinia furnacalis]
MWKILFTSALAALVVSVKAGAAPDLCCQDGLVLLRRQNVCWNPKVNKTSPVTALSCKQKLKLSRFSINSDGDLVLMGSSRNVTLDHRGYCIANQTRITDPELTNVSLAALICQDNDDKIIDEKVAGYCMIVSVIFLFFTALIYCVLPEMRDLQGKSLIAFCISLGLGMMVLVIMKLMPPYRDMNLCAARGFLAYFFILSSFFWTNAISIQILLCIRRPSTLNYEWRDFMLYACYGWGVPAVLTLALALVNFLPVPGLPDHKKPGIGLNHCWFYGTEHQWYYMYSIMSILIFANICIFIYISICLWKNTFATSHLKALRYKFLMTTRLFILMGITWIFEMISSLVEINIGWVIMDIYNTMQGLFIFLVLVVFRRRVVKALYKRGWLDCAAGPLERWLAVGDDDEQDVIEHTKDVPLEDKCLS